MTPTILRAARQPGKAATHPATLPLLLPLLGLLLATPAAAQRPAFDDVPIVPRTANKVPYAGPQTGGKPPPLGDTGPDRVSPFANGPTIPPRPGDRGSASNGPVPNGPLPNGPLPGGPVPSGRPSSSGTGFVVAPGRVMTNNHVVADCARTVARNAAGTRVNARVLGTDTRRDLAILAVTPDLGPALAFRVNPPVRRGETVVIYGFPLYGLLSAGPTLTTGVLSALSGIKDSPLNFEITAPVNPGNSGGPMLDDHGNVIGVVVAKINALRVAQITDGDIPQNVNFAVKGTEALAFLQSQNVATGTATSINGAKTPADIGDIANASTMFLECFR